MEGKLDRLAFRFFKLFAQYESTLKERGYFYVRNGHIFVGWDRFANEIIGHNFLNALGEVASEAEYILENPPMKQEVNNFGNIIWAEVQNNDRSVQALFSHIRRMRNNLFHGAKFNGEWFDPKRSQKLLKAGLIILEHYRDWLKAENQIWLN